MKASVTIGQRAVGASICNGFHRDENWYTNELYFFYLAKYIHQIPLQYPFQTLAEDHSMPP